MSAQRWASLLLLSLGYCLALLYGQLSIPVVVTLGLLIMAGICARHFQHRAVRLFGHALFIALAGGWPATGCPVSSARGPLPA